MGHSGESADYVRFIILGHARTGSNMLAFSLNSSPHIICFGEIFLPMRGTIGYFVKGYDNSSVDDRALRNRDFKRFLEERIFCAHPRAIHAVGYKMAYVHFPWFPGLLEWMTGDTELRVLHLKRRNLLRLLVSLRIAQTTGKWMDVQPATIAARLTPVNALRAVRHPLRAADSLRRQLQREKPTREPDRAPVLLKEAECRDFFRDVERDADHYGGLFRHHPCLTLYYEDLLRDYEGVFNQVQAFLDLEPRTLSITTRRQNPEPLHKLIANYGELRAAFEGTPEASFFE